MMHRWGAPLLAFGISVLGPHWGIPQTQALALSLLIWMMWWWISETVPLWVTSLLPLIMGPFLTFVPMKQLTEQYAAEIIFLFLGGFLFARALEKSHVPLFLAQFVVSKFGRSYYRVMFSLVFMTSFLSAWISNTASATIMIPLSLALLKSLGYHHHHSQKITLLAVAYAASVGGLMTIVGSTPNALLVGQLALNGFVPPHFLSWLYVGLPFTIAGVLIIIFVMFVWSKLNRTPNEPDPLIVLSSAQDLPISLEKRDKHLLFLMGILVSGWLLGPSLKISGFSDSAWVLFCVLFLLFPIKVKSNEGVFSTEAHLESSDIKNISWDVLLLFGGGLALAKVLDVSGLLTSHLNLFMVLTQLPELVALWLLIIFFILLTEISSNTAAASLGIPFALALSHGLGMNPVIAMSAAAFASSLSFMLPMATPANAIVFGTGHLRIKEMMGVGTVLNVLFSFLILVFAYWIVPLFWNTQK